MINIEKLNKMDACRHFMPDPVPEVVGELIAYVRCLRDALRTGLEYARECRDEHDRKFGRTTDKNRGRGDLMDKEIKEMEELLKRSGDGQG